MPIVESCPGTLEIHEVIPLEAVEAITCFKVSHNHPGSVNQCLASGGNLLLYHDWLPVQLLKAGC